jgi:hypothetical protein
MPEDRKCGFGIVNLINLNFEQFTSEQQSILKLLLDRPPLLQKSIVSASGFFRIHYDTTGFNVPSYVAGWSVNQNVAEVANSLDSVYRFEINYLGYLSPPSDVDAGGDNRYDIYITSQGAGLYGYTEWENKVGAINWTSFMVIDNDYPASQYYSAGLNGMRVTVAHEFHHGIQLGNYSVQNGNSPVRDSDIFFYEITSTSMEEFVYDDVNDYYAYMGSYFHDPELAFPRHNGYNLAIWNIFLMENFGFGILKRQWELIPSIAAILSINQSLNEASTSFPRELNKFGIWTFFTGFRWIPGEYFEEAANYPLIVPLQTITFNSPFQTVHGDVQATSNNFIKFDIAPNGDTLFAIITNGDANSATFLQNPLFLFDYTLYDDSSSGQRKLTALYSSYFYVNNPSFWSVSEILNQQLVYQDSTPIPPSGSVSYAYPNPFSYGKSYSTSQFVFFPYDGNVGEEVDFNVYSVGMQLVFSSLKIIQNLAGGQHGVSWNALDIEGQKLASGVYIYVIKKGDEVLKGKVVIFNE